MSLPPTTPAEDELEVSIFGPGIGESVVVHLGRGKWMIVDSCIDGATRQPAALEYLGRLGVDVARDVVLLVVTHWHDDHTAGMADVLRACESAALFCSSAVGTREFFALVASARQTKLEAGAGSGLDEMSRILGILSERRTRSLGRTTSPHYAHAGTIVYRDGPPPCVVEALSPSSATLTRSLLSLPVLNQPKRAIPNPGPNELSVALHVRLGDVAALLGADLETGSSDAMGWRAVVCGGRLPSPAASIVKVPHHGSNGADHPPVWRQLVTEWPVAGVTPFSSSGLPSESDQERLRVRTRFLGHTSPSAPRTARFDKVTERTLTGIRIRERRGHMGQVRFRVTAAGGVTDCQLFGAAKAV
jgi:beta-lactamase superfamily II metal-dependent hydrolase